jgi:hypothetical protein
VFAPLAALVSMVLWDTMGGWSAVVAPFTACVGAGLTATKERRRVWPVAITTLVLTYVLWFPALVLVLLIVGLAG